MVFPLLPDDHTYSQCTYHRTSPSLTLPSDMLFIFYISQSALYKSHALHFHTLNKKRISQGQQAIPRYPLSSCRAVLIFKASLPLQNFAKFSLMKINIISHKAVGCLPRYIPLGAASTELRRALFPCTHSFKSEAGSWHEKGNQRAVA